MSDGPHRSLNMHRSWRRLAECADNKAHSIEEVASAYIPALAQTCDAELPATLLRELVRIFGEKQQALFKGDKSEEITSLRRSVAGFPLANAVLDAAERCEAKGVLGMDGLVSALADGLRNRAARANRQVEEHYYRASNEGRTQGVRDRMEAALNGAALESLSRARLNMDGAAKPSRTSRHSGLDDGVQLP